MEYVNVLTMVMDTDHKTTKGFSSLFEDVPTEFFVDSNLLSDTQIINKTKDGRYVAVYKNDDNVVFLDYFINGKGSIKSCNQKVQFQFNPEIREELKYLDPNTLTTSDNDLDQYIWCMEATVFDLIRDNVDLNHITEKEKYSISYHLRKNTKNHFYLESKIWFNTNKKLNNQYQITETSIFHDLAPSFQRLIKGSENMSEAEKLAEIDEIKQKFGDFYDDEYYEDCEDEDEYENEYEDEYEEYENEYESEEYNEELESDNDDYNYGNSMSF